MFHWCYGTTWPPPQLKPERPVIDYCKGSHIMAYQYLMDVNGDFTPMLMDIFPVNGPKHMDVRGDYLQTSGKSPTELVDEVLSTC